MAQLEAVALENLEAARYVTLGEHIWSSLLGPKLEVGTKSREAVSY